MTFNSKFKGNNKQINIVRNQIFDNLISTHYNI